MTKERFEAILANADKLYQDDRRIRMLVDSSYATARDELGPIDPERADRDARDLALRALTILASRIFTEDAELQALRGERNRYRQLAEDAITFIPGPCFVIESKDKA